MKRKNISLHSIAEFKNLNSALHKASKAKRQRSEVQAFYQSIDARIAKLSECIRNEIMPIGDYKIFEIYDPKKRLIHAACFEDRIFHHAMMNLAGPVLDSAMHDHSYACRKGFGVHHAIERVQLNCRRYHWYVKIDIKAYFASISHERLMGILITRFKGEQFINQLHRIIDTYHVEEGIGLPIGSLTSQYFANYYLDGLDRFLDNNPLVRSWVRYMDDTVWWCDSREAAQQTLKIVQNYLSEQRRLTIKSSVQINQSQHGISFCGVRVLPGIIRLSRRRKKRYQQRRLFWEIQCQRDLITPEQLQNAYAAIHAMTSGTDSLAWRSQNLLRYQAIDV